MAAFRTPVDIVNRALQTLRRPAIYSFDDTSVEAHESKVAYDQLRLAELRRAVWRFSTRRVVLRAITNTAQLFTAPNWAIATTYGVGDLVAYANQTWVAMTANTGQTPGTVPASGTLFWDFYFGPLIVDVWNAPVSPGGSGSAGHLNPTGYFTDELVYKTPGDGTYTVYLSLISANTNDPEAVDPWLDDTIYLTGQVVKQGGTNYQSLHALNFNNPPSSSPSQWTATVTSPLVSNSWRAVSTSALSPIGIVYPLGAGPAADTRTRNAYRLPAGFLRRAPTDPLADINPFLGAPTGNIRPDWLFESDYIVSRQAQPIMLRFVCDCQSVPAFDALFAVGLSERIAIELAPRLADAEHLATILSTAREDYARTITEARTINGIETGPVDAYEDDFITARL